MTIFIVLCVVIVLMLAFDTRLAVRNYTVNNHKVHNNIRIALITDLHSCYYGSEQYKLIDEINKQHPDVILYGGDIVDDILPPDNTIIVLKALMNLYPSYYVSGNHEYRSGEVEKIKEMFRSYGVIVLEDEGKAIILNGQEINICGVDDLVVGGKEYLKQIENSLKDIDTSLFTVFLAHRPEHINEYVQYDFNLILSGHAHGGQWRIPGVLNGLIAPNQGLFPNYAGGRYEFNDKTFIVSRGLSRESTRIPRIFNPPELVIVDVVASKNS